MTWKGEPCGQLICDTSQYICVLKLILLSGLVLSRLLSSKPQTLSPKPTSLSGPVAQQSPQAKQTLSYPLDWKSFLSSTKDERLKTDSSCLAMIEAEQGELFEAIRRALQSLRKNKVLIKKIQEAAFKLLLTCQLTLLFPQGPIQEQRKEIAAVIQRCYKRYKQVRAVG